jgi:hypothetical protein
MDQPRSYDPMSYPAPRGREIPRWSVEGAKFGALYVTLSIARLPGESAKVRLGPPLEASGPSKGSTLWIDPKLEPQPQVALLSRLLPPSVIALFPAQFPPELLLARMVLRRVVLPQLLNIPPPAMEALFPEKVQFVMVSVSDPAISV